MELEELQIYGIARELSRIGWNVYRELKNEYRFGIGRQYLEAADSVGANIAEGYGRYHYLDSIKFYYNARGSLWEFKHWTDLLHERDLISKEVHEESVTK
ncbi:MAG TPA: four helix bundle protein [Syntrophorhabdaceae bacterium]